MTKKEDQMEKIVSFAKRRGFIFQSSEIYGGMAGIYDFGPLGVEMKRNLKNIWWQKFIQSRDDMVGMDAAIIMNPKVWQASGHTGEDFADILFECKKCHHRFREDDLKEEGKKGKYRCPDCQGELTDPKAFNILVKTYLGPVEDTSTLTYLRGETAQGIFVNFQNILDSTRKKIPFGIGQIGKAFRNEITPGNFIFRTREFEQAEIEYFIKPEEADKYFAEWLNTWEEFFQKDLGLDKKNLKLRPHKKDELAHYSKATTDIEYRFPFGWSELAGVANRTDFDLKTHQKDSGQEMTYFDQETKKRYHPYIIEPTLGIDRALLAVIVDAFEEVGKREKGSKSKNREIVLKLPKALAPYQVAVFPLIKDKELIKIAQSIYKEIKKNHSVFYDQTGSIGRRYRRQDEIGTPYCITIDFDTKKDKKATIRDRDTMKQERVKLDKIGEWLDNNLVTT